MPPIVEMELRDGLWQPFQYGYPAPVTDPDPQPGGWTPSQLGFIERPIGGNYIRIEDIPVSSTDLRAAAVHPLAHNKVITLPPGTFELNDFVQGSGVWMHGLMVNPSTSTYYCRGFVGSGAGTVIQMAPNSSHFTMATGGQGTENTTQFPQNTILFYGVPGLTEFGNLVLQGTAQPHYYHGFRSTGNTWVHHLRTMGAAQGAQNMPPGETYSCAVGGTNSIIEDSEFDGRRTVGGAPVSSTVCATLSAVNPVLRRIHCHDLLSGFGVVQWEGTGLYTEDMWVTRPGTGTSGWNGAHTNHEKGAGPIRHVRPVTDLDGYYGPDTPGRTRRHQGKFGHFLFLRPDNAQDYADVRIEEPVFDAWGGMVNAPGFPNTPGGGFAVMWGDAVADAVSTRPVIIKNGVILQPVTRAGWWINSPVINPATHYWAISTYGASSVWG